MNPLLKNFVSVILILLVVGGIFSLLYYPSQNPNEISATQLVNDINQNKVKKITVSGDQLSILYNDDTNAVSMKEASSSLTDLLSDLGASKDNLQKVEIDVKVAKENLWSWLTPILIFGILPLVVFGLFFWTMIRQAKSGAVQVFDFTKAKARLFGAEGHGKEKITFKDVAGLKEAKEELVEIVDFLKFPKKYLAMGAKIPRGVLLMGAAGTGKTLLARAVAGEANVPFFSISGSEFVELFVGTGAARVRDLFSTAKKSAPCLSGDTLITLENGKEVPIKEIFDKKILGIKIPSINKNLQIENDKLIGVIKRGKKEIYEIKTYHSSIKATGNHLFPILKNGKMEWVEVKNLTKNDHVASPRKIKRLENVCNGEIFWSKITDIKKLPKRETVYDLCLEKNHNFLANRMFVHNCIVFIDEIDAVGRMRGSGIGGSHDEREQTLNQILVEMDGFERETNLIVISATNRGDILDPALTRPGRFDRKVVLDMPDVHDREETLKIHSKGKPLNGNVDFKEVAERTPGFSGADLANVANEAALLAARQNKKEIHQKEFLESIEKVLLGPERRSHILSRKEKEIAAYHEAGHALVSSSLPGTEPIRKISIIARGMAAGYTLQTPSEERKMKTKTQFLCELSTLLGGYCAEKIKFGEMTTGASNDLTRASDLARKLIKEYGMSSLGPISFGEKEELVFLGKEISEQRNYSEKVAAKIDEEVEKFIRNAEKEATGIIIKRRELLDKIAKTLIEKETIEREEFEKLINGGKLLKKK